MVPSENPPKKTSRLPWRELDGHAVIIHAARGEVHELNELGSFIWKHLDGANTQSDIARFISEEFEIDLQTAQADSEEFLSAMRANGLVE